MRPWGETMDSEHPIRLELTTRERFLISLAIRQDEFEEEVAQVLGPSALRDLRELQEEFDRLSKSR